MAKQITRWSPDHCSCVVEFSWDDTTPAENQVFAFNATVATCDAHKHLANTEAHLTTLFEENKRKNITLQDCADAAGVVLAPAEEDVKLKSNARQFSTPEDKLVFEYSLKAALHEKALKFHRDYNYSFDKDRNLVVDHPSLTGPMKAALKSNADSKHGANKVKFK